MKTIKYTDMRDFCTTPKGDGRLSFYNGNSAVVEIDGKKKQFRADEITNIRTACDYGGYRLKTHTMITRFDMMWLALIFFAFAALAYCVGVKVGLQADETWRGASIQGNPATCLNPNR